MLKSEIYEAYIQYTYAQSTKSVDKVNYYGLIKKKNAEEKRKAIFIAMQTVTLCLGVIFN